MAQMQPMLELPAATPFARSRRTRLPGWVALLLGSPKARVGLGIVLGMVLLGLLAPLLVPASKATEFSLVDARQAPSLHHVFGTSDLIHAAVPAMEKQPPRDTWRGQIMIVSSAAARRAPACPHAGLHTRPAAADCHRSR